MRLSTRPGPPAGWRVPAAGAGAVPVPLLCLPHAHTHRQRNVGGHRETGPVEPPSQAAAKMSRTWPSLACCCHKAPYAAADCISTWHAAVSAASTPAVTPCSFGPHAAMHAGTARSWWSRPAACPPWTGSSAWCRRRCTRRRARCAGVCINTPVERWSCKLGRARCVCALDTWCGMQAQGLK